MSSNLDKYIEKVNKFIKDNPNLTEELLIRYVYMDLGKRFSFNSQFLPFGNSKKRQEIYYKSGILSELDKCMEDNIVICKSEAKILEYILKHLGVNIETVVQQNDFRKCPHVYNIIKPKDGKKPYSIDLQEDMYRIKMHGFTVNYGLSLEDETKAVIPRFKQEQMDRFLGFVDDKNFYTDEYFYTLKSDFNCLETLRQKAKFLLENIDVFENPNMEYTDKMWYHVRILQDFFNEQDFDYENGTGKIHIINCYKKFEDKTKYLNCVTVQTAEGIDIYVYNNKQGKYSEIDILNLAKAVKNGLVLHNAKIPGLGETLKKLKEDDQKTM